MRRVTQGIAWGFALLGITALVSLMGGLQAQDAAGGQGVTCVKPQDATLAAKKCVALVIGNSTYAKAGRLPNAVADARAIGATLKRLGFAVTVAEDLPVRTFDETLETFFEAAEKADVALFYYAGHALQLDQENHLMAVDSVLATESAVRRETVSAQEIVARMERAAGINLVFLDACRNNPLSDRLQTVMAQKGRSVGRGLARMTGSSGRDTLIVFSTAPGQEALDSAAGGDHSPFAVGLLAHMEAPVEIETMLKRVTTTASQEAEKEGRQQQPERLSKLQSEFYFKPVGTPKPPTPVAVPGAPVPVVPSPQTAAEREWAGVDKTSFVELKTFIGRHGQSPQADYARARFAALEDQEKTEPEPERATPAPVVVDPTPPSSPPVTPPKDKVSDKKTAPPPVEKSSTPRQTAALDPEAAQVAPSEEPLAIDPTRAGQVFRECWEGVGVRSWVEEFLTSEVDKKEVEMRMTEVDSELVSTCGPKMVVVPAGTFTMGSPETDEVRSSDEGPQRTVIIEQPFAVGKFEVTWAEWDACVADGGCDDAGPREEGGDNGWGRGQHPLINVSWDDAQSYIKWLNKKTGQTYRLLSEAEWEYAARGGPEAKEEGTLRYWWGDTASDAYANYGVDKCCGGLIQGKDAWEHTAPVGRFSANPFGLHDLHGNVWEWVEDCYVDTYKNAPTDGQAVATGECSTRVHRGGSWNDAPLVLRSAHRTKYAPDGRDNAVGFRLARTLL